MKPISAAYKLFAVCLLLLLQTSLLLAQIETYPPVDKVSADFKAV